MPSSKNKFRILIFHPALAPYRIDLFNKLSERFHLKVIFFYENLLSQPFDQERLKSLLKCEFDYLLSGFSIGSRYFRWGIANNISNFKPDVVVSTEYSLNSIFISLIKLFFIKKKFYFIVMTDDNNLMCDNTILLRVIARKLVLYNTDSLVVINNSIKVWYEKKYKKLVGRVGVCPIIQEETPFLELQKSAISISNKYLQKYNLLNKCVFLYVGRLVNVKGVDRLVKAFSIVSKTISEIVLVIVGDGPEQKNILKLSKQLNIEKNVKIVGRFEGEELIAWFLIGQVFVLASSHEPYGAVVNEALISGMPVLCSSNAGSSELIIPGYNGYIFDPYDINNLSILIKKLFYTIKPLQRDSIKIRKNLMPISFASAVDGFNEAVKAVTQ